MAPMGHQKGNATKSITSPCIRGGGASGSQKASGEALTQPSTIQSFESGGSSEGKKYLQEVLEEFQMDVKEKMNLCNSGSRGRSVRMRTPSSKLNEWGKTGTQQMTK